MSQQQSISSSRSKLVAELLERGIIDYDGYSEYYRLRKFRIVGTRNTKVFESRYLINLLQGYLDMPAEQAALEIITADPESCKYAILKQKLSE